jgi:hypothetical protein
MAKFYPHRQTIIIFIVCCVLVAGTVVYTRIQQPPEFHSQTVMEPLGIGLATSSVTITTSTSTDWKKLFFNENSSAFSLSTKKTASSSDAGALSPTEQLGRDAFIEFAFLHKAGLADNASVVSSTVATIVAKDFSSISKPDMYTADSVILAPTDDAASLKAYGNELGQLLKAYAPAQSSISIAFDGWQGNDSTYMDELKSNAADYQNILNGLLSMPVPESLASHHLGLINGINYTHYVTTSLMLIKSDPVDALAGIQSYQTAFSLVVDNLVPIRKSLKDAGITYDPSEPGSYLNI